jgi:sec-independent protein translocase protein TatA
MLRALDPWHLVILGSVVLVLFGAKRLPDSARSIGQSLRILRSETVAMSADTEQAVAASPAPVPATPADRADVPRHPNLP